MKRKSIMLLAGEPSGDLLAAELVAALREELALRGARFTPEAQPLRTSLDPQFFGVGGPCLAAAGVDLALDLTAHSINGLGEVLRKFFFFVALKRRLFRLALERQPDAIICVDFSGFNRRFAHTVRHHVRRTLDWFHQWNPKIIQYVSPQVWASRPGRARAMARDYDLLLAIFPFEKRWYAERVPDFRVEWVGHPLLDRYRDAGPTRASDASNVGHQPPWVVLLPGSRPEEIRRHLPLMLETQRLVHAARPARWLCVLPNDALMSLARQVAPEIPGAEWHVGGLGSVLAQADLAIASTGTVTLECALFGVPTVTLYKTNRLNYEIARRIVAVKWLTMPNLLAGETIYPEFLQDAATPAHLASAALDLLQDNQRREKIRARLKEIIASLGEPGASRRAAQLIAEII